MAPFYGDSALLPVLFVCLALFCLFLDPSSGIVQYDRFALLHIRDNMPTFRPDLPLDFQQHRERQKQFWKPRKRGARGGTLVQLWRRIHRPALPSLVLSNVRSLVNKMDELSLLTRSQRDFRDAAAICLTETWLDGSFPDSSLQLPGFSFHRADRTTNSLKQRGGGVGCYINSNWCTDYKILSQTCTPELESLTVICKPFYSPREFSAVVLIIVYIPPDASAPSALQQLADHIMEVENSNPDAAMIALGDFNHVTLKKVLPRYKPHIHIATRLDKTLDQCYSPIPEAFHAVARAPLGKSDHNSILLIPKYRQKLKVSKPTVKHFKCWSPQAIETLQDCLDSTVWSNFWSDGQDDIDSFTDTVTAYIQFCESVCIPVRTVTVFNNSKPWFNNELRLLCRKKHSAFKCGDMTNYKKLKYDFQRAVVNAKASYKAKLEKKLQANDIKGVWQGLQDITDFKTKHHAPVSDPALPDKLNNFYCRFDDGVQLPAPCYKEQGGPPPTVFEHDVRILLRQQNTRKASGPDGVASATLRHCADQLTPVLTCIFNWSLQLAIVPACFKSAVIIPVPKKHKITCLNDYRPVALTSVIMKIFERLVCKHLSSITLDPQQFAYRTNRSVDDAVSLCLHSILQHLESKCTYARVLFVDFSSAFNTIVPVKLINTLQELGVSTSLCRWIFNFLCDRKQVVRIGDYFSQPMLLNIGAPQGCVLSPLLYSLYTHFCQSHSNSVLLYKFADDTSVVGLITNKDESDYRREVDELVGWCDRNNLILNISKTKELVVDFRKTSGPLSTLSIKGVEVERVTHFQFLGTTIHESLSWDLNTNIKISKAHQRLHFLRQLRKFKVSQTAMIHFYRATIESVLTFSILVWFGNTTSWNKTRLERVVRRASKIIGANLPSLSSLFSSRLIRKARKIIVDPSHPAHHLFNLLPSGRRYRSLRTSTSRFRDSTYPLVIRHLNLL